MKKTIKIFLIILSCTALTSAFAIPPEDSNHCIDPTQNYPTATGYCNNVNPYPGVTTFYCEEEIGGAGQTKTCIGNTPY